MESDGTQGSPGGQTALSSGSIPEIDTNKIKKDAQKGKVENTQTVGPKEKERKSREDAPNPQASGSTNTSVSTIPTNPSTEGKNPANSSNSNHINATTTPSTTGVPTTSTASASALPKSKGATDDKKKEATDSGRNEGNLKYGGGETNGAGSTIVNVITSGEEASVLNGNSGSSNVPTAANSIPQTNASTPMTSPTSANPPSILNKSIISNINKSLKAKQKIINSKEPHPKNTTLISDIMNKDGTQSTTSTLSAPPSTAPTNVQTPSSELFSHPNTSSHSVEKESAPPKRKNKRIAKQALTRTDFFAAKLASAVDDVDSSDLNETFVYESQADDNDVTVQDDIKLPNKISQSQQNLGGLSNQHNQSQPIQSKKLSGSANLNVLPFSERSSGLQSPTDEYRNVNTDMGRPPSIAGLCSSSYVDQGNRRLATQRLFSSYTYLEDQYHPGANQGSTFGGSQHGLVGSNPLQASSNQESIGPHANLDGVGQPGTNQSGSLGNAPNGVTSGSSQGNTPTLVTSSNAGAQASMLPYEPSIPGSARRFDQYLLDELDLNEESDVSEDGEVAKPPQPPRKPHTKSLTSSKLRSTTSKLFDKIGSQPRRYSIIPDDIDIEDFDDELIYYDNNIRFPYSQQPTIAGLPHENLQLLGQPRLAHYRSLNLNFPPGKRVKNRRYLSMPVHHQSPPPAGQDFENQNYYFDYEDLDEESQETPKAGSTRYVSRHPLGYFVKKQQARMNFVKSFAYTVVSIVAILAVGFVMGFVLASTKELTDVSITAVENPVVSADELVFNIVVQAVNPGWFNVEVADVELDIFAKSGYLETDLLKSLVETVLLGTVYSFELPMVFEGGIFNRGPVEQIGLIKMVTPGKNLTGVAMRTTGPHETKRHSVVIEDKTNQKLDKALSDPMEIGEDPETQPQAPHSLDSDQINLSSLNNTEPDNLKKWEVIIKNPFDLIIRGVLKYSLPMQSGVKSVVVNRVGYIDPGELRAIA